MKQTRKPWAARLPQGTIDRIKEIATTTGGSQSDVVASAIAARKQKIDVAPRTVSSVLVSYGPFRLGDNERWEAWIGDKLLGAAVSLQLLTMEPKCAHQAFGYIVSNSQLASVFPDDFPVACRGPHGKGTVIECAIFRMYKAEGWDAVLSLAAQIVRVWLQQHDVNGQNPQPRPVFKPTTAKTSHQTARAAVNNGSRTHPGSQFGATSDEIKEWAKHHLNRKAEKKGMDAGTCRICGATKYLVRKPLVFMDGPALDAFCPPCQNRLLTVVKKNRLGTLRLEAAIQTVRATL